MIRAVVGSPILIATGIMMAMIDMGPRPGSMPMKVPIRHPATTMIRFWKVRAVVRPNKIPSSMVRLPHAMNQGHGLRKMPSISCTRYQMPKAPVTAIGIMIRYRRSPRMNEPPARNSTVEAMKPMGRSASA